MCSRRSPGIRWFASCADVDFANRAALKGVKDRKAIRIIRIEQHKMVVGDKDSEGYQGDFRLVAIRRKAKELRMSQIFVKAI